MAGTADAGGEGRGEFTSDAACELASVSGGGDTDLERPVGECRKKGKATQVRGIGDVDGNPQTAAEV